MDPDLLESHVLYWQLAPFLWPAALQLLLRLAGHQDAGTDALLAGLHYP